MRRGSIARFFTGTPAYVILFWIVIWRIFRITVINGAGSATGAASAIVAMLRRTVPQKAEVNRGIKLVLRGI